MLSSKKFKIAALSLVIVLLFLVVASEALATAPAVNNALGGLDNTATGGGIKTSTSQTDLPTIIGGVVGAVLALVGVVFFLLILYAGFNWMMAQGQEEKITKAKETIFSAVLGLIVVLGAYAITTLAADLFGEALGMPK